MWRFVVMCTVACLEPNPSPRLQICVLCPFRGGAMKKCTTGAWCHVACAIWVPEVAFENAVVRVLECVLCVAVWPCDCVAVWLCGCLCPSTLIVHGLGVRFYCLQSMASERGALAARG